MGSCPSDQKSAVTVGTSGQNDDLSSGVTILACEVQGYLVVPDEATRKEAEEEEARNFHEKATAEKAAATASPEAALTPPEQLALAKKKGDYGLCDRLTPFVGQYLAAEAQLGVALAAEDFAQAEKAKLLVDMSFEEWTIAKERKVAAEKAAAEKAAAEKAAAKAFAARPKSKPLGKELNTLLEKKSPSPQVTAEALDLIAKDADVTVVNGDGNNTPLHFAALKGHPNCVGPLVKAGARLEATTKVCTVAFGWFVAVVVVGFFKVSPSSSTSLLSFFFFLFSLLFCTRVPTSPVPLPYFFPLC